MAVIQYCIRPMIKALICLSIMCLISVNVTNHWEAVTWPTLSRRKSNITDHSDLLAPCWIPIGPQGQNQNQQPLWSISLEPDGATASAAGSCQIHDITVWELLHFPPSSTHYQACSRLHSGKPIKTNNSHFFICHSTQTGILQPQRSEVRGWCSEQLCYNRTVRTHKFLLVIRGRCSSPPQNQLWCGLSGIPKD